MSLVCCTDEQILSSSLPASSVAVPAAAPPACQPKSATNGQHPVPRLSISSRATVVARMEGASQGGLQTVMKWKTVVAIFVVVVVYLVTGGLVFRALEQPFESSQKNTIALEKAEFLRDHICVSPQELETLIQGVVIGPHSDSREHGHDQGLVENQHVTGIQELLSLSLTNSLPSLQRM
ncbi:hypothetical protein ACRRTK_017641 [Alexandromys fortis]